MGKANESVALLSDRIQEISRKADRYKAIAADYAALPEQARTQTLVLTGTNASRLKLNELIHDALGLKGKGHQRDLLTRVDTTQAERSHAGYYKAGDFLQPERSYANGLESGVLYSILQVSNGQLTVRANDDPAAAAITFNPARASKLSVYRLQRMELSPGDRVKVTRHDASNDLANGAEYVVASVSDSGITLSDATRQVVIAGTGPLHLDLAYVGTVHGSQGQTKDSVIMNLETESRTTKRDTFYVGISRVREDLKIFTDKADSLARAVNRNEEKTAALDIEKSHRPGNRGLETDVAQPAARSATAESMLPPQVAIQQSTVPARTREMLASHQAMSWAIRHLTERESVISHDALLNSALTHGETTVSVDSIKQELDRRVETGHLLLAEPRFRPANKKDGPALTAKAWVQALVQQGHPAGQAKAIVRQSLTAGRLVETERHYTTQAALEREKRILPTSPRIQ